MSKNCYLRNNNRTSTETGEQDIVDILELYDNKELCKESDVTYDKQLKRNKKPPVKEKPKHLLLKYNQNENKCTGRSEGCLISSKPGQKPTVCKNNCINDATLIDPTKNREACNRSSVSVSVDDVLQRSIPGSCDDETGVSSLHGVYSLTTTGVQHHSSQVLNQPYTRLSCNNLQSCKKTRTASCQEVSDHLLRDSCECEQGSVKGATFSCAGDPGPPTPSDHGNCGPYQIAGGSWMQHGSHGARMEETREIKPTQQSRGKVAHSPNTHSVPASGDSASRLLCSSTSGSLPSPTGSSRHSGTGGTQRLLAEGRSSGANQLEEFLEGINLSIDELISADKGCLGEVCAVTDNGNCCDLNGAQSEVCSNSDLCGIQSTGGINSVELNNYDTIMDKDKSLVLEDESSVVETDAGFYWVTCSIDEETGHTNTANAEDLDCVDGGIQGEEMSTSVHICVTDVDDRTCAGQTDQEEYDIGCTTVNVCQSQADPGNDNTGSASGDSSRSSVHGSPNTSQGDSDLLQPLSEDEVRTDTRCSSERNSIDSELSDSTQSSEQNVLNRSAPCVELSDRLSVPECQRPRKNSFPGSLFKVFKVVSIDIPKMDLLHIKDKCKKHQSKSSDSINFATKSKGSRQRHSAEFDKKHDRNSAQSDTAISISGFKTSDKHLTRKHSLPSSFMRLQSSLKTKSMKMKEGSSRSPANENHSNNTTHGSQSTNGSQIPVCRNQSTQGEGHSRGQACPDERSAELSPVLEPPPAFASVRTNFSFTSWSH